MSALELNKRITIQQPTQSKGTAGGKKETWTDLATVWAGIRNPSGNERRASSHGGEVAEARTEFKIRYLATVEATMRVSFNSKLYNIKHVNNLNEANRWMILTCDTGVNDG
jgi:SPP1 family predicted phage head-tail adaptor